jgi:hypothetical protein
MRQFLIPLTPEPHLANQSAGRKADPKSYPEKLARLEVCQTARRKEHAHHGTTDRDSEQDGYRPEEPSPFHNQFAAPQEKVGAGERVEKKGVKH